VLEMFPFGCSHDLQFHYGYREYAPGMPGHATLHKIAAVVLVRLSLAS
jgi:hypothetical protein